MCCTHLADVIPPLHITLGRLINRAYTDAFLANPAALDLSDLGYVLVDVIIGTDPGAVVTTYGFVAKLADFPAAVTAGQFVAVIRGTNSPGEWFEDFKAILVGSDFCAGCETELGFTEIYKTLRLSTGMKLKDGLAAIEGLACSGHSLGGPLATMLAAEVGAAVLVGFASPKPGNAKFAAWVRARVGSIDLYANAPDVVPHTPLTLPPFEEFQHVDCLNALDSSKVVAGGLRAAHDLNTYLRLLDPTLLIPPCT